jgi:hypothetical protein
MPKIQPNTKSFLSALNLIISLLLFDNLISDLTIQMPKEGVNGGLNSLYLLGFLIGDIKAKILLHGNNQLHRVQGIKP